MIFEEFMAEIRNRIVLRGIESKLSQIQGANSGRLGNIACRGKWCTFDKLEPESVNFFLF